MKMIFGAKRKAAGFLKCKIYELRKFEIEKSDILVFAAKRKGCERKRTLIGSAHTVSGSIHLGTISNHQY